MPLTFSQVEEMPPKKSPISKEITGAFLLPGVVRHAKIAYGTI